jgi:hypothetical protein
MIYKEMSIEDIDSECEEFRISEELNITPVLESLREIGQLNPVILLGRNPRKVVVCGFRRIYAMQRLGFPRISVGILDESCDSLKAFRLAIWDNLSHRQLNPLEKARVLFKLQSLCGVLADKIVKDYLPLLGLAPHESVLGSFLSLHAIQPDLKQCLVEGKLTLSSLEILAKTACSIQDRIALLMGNIRLSASLQKKVLSLLEDLAAMTNAPFDAPLNQPEAMAILEDPRLSPFQKGEKLHELLYGLRNPRLSQAQKQFLARKKLLGLPGSIQINPHPFFETSDLHVEFNAPDAARFRDLAAMLQKAAQLQELEELYEE